MANDFRPVIGIPARSIVDSNNGFRYSGIPLTYSNSVERAGGAPILIPLHLSEETLKAIYARIDALLLAGGVDVHPKEFGEEVMPYCGEIDTARDETELRVTRRAAVCIRTFPRRFRRNRIIPTGRATRTICARIRLNLTPTRASRAGSAHRNYKSTHCTTKR